MGIKNHKSNCQCIVCKNKRKEPHKKDCNCASCKSKRGELSGKNNGMYGVHRFGKNNPYYKDGRTLRKHKCIKRGCNKKVKFGSKFCKKHYKEYCKSRIGNKNGHYGKKFSKRSKKLMRFLALKRWKNKNYRNKVTSLKNIKKRFKSLKIIPNKKEKLLNSLLEEILSNEYKFVGDGKIWITKFNPDFINVNGQKKIIEFFGDYWHNLPKIMKRDKRRLKIYKDYGYKVLIIWQNELKDKNKLKNKILAFNKK